METKLTRITEIIKEDTTVKVNNVMHILGSPENLIQCFYELKRKKASGVDGVKWEDYEQDLEGNVRNLIGRMKKWQYRPQPVRRTYIEKANGKLRPLGIPATEDKIVQQGVRKILDAVYEPLFLDCSYGFRQGRSCHDALKSLNDMLQWRPVNYVIDADIKGFFDNVDHKWMIEFLRHKIADKKLVRLIVRMLKSGVMEEGTVSRSEDGTPQGGIVSPVLANVYLHYVLDLWIEKVVKKHCRGYISMVRYADDFVICAEHRDEADRIIQSLHTRFSKFNLELSAEKTKVVQFGRKAVKRETFNFLGFTHFNDKTRKGTYKVGRKTERKRLCRALKDLNTWLRKSRNLSTADQLWKTIAAKLRGHFQYYGVSGNSRALYRFYRTAIMYVRKWFNRRSQKKSFNWQKFYDYLVHYPLPKPRIHHNFYTGYSYA